MSGYASDIARTCVACDPGELERTEQQWDNSLVACLLSVGMGQNHGKKEWLVRFVGKHARCKVKYVLGAYSGLRGQPKLVTRYLGAWDDADGHAHVEVPKRLQEAAAAWRSFGGWWRVRDVPVKRRVMVFQSVVLASLLSGLEASVGRQVPQEPRSKQVFTLYLESRELLFLPVPSIEATTMVKELLADAEGRDCEDGNL